MKTLARVAMAFTFAWHYARSCTPWGKAFVLLSLKKYVESEVYKERVATMGKERAIEQYVKHDFRYWTRKITFWEKLAIMIKPYSFIEEFKRREE